MSVFHISGQLVDLFDRSIYPAKISITDGKIVSVERKRSAPAQYILPGFIDAHIHIESSMLIPSAFAAIAVMHGTVATVSDPHEIANVCGLDGVEFMIADSKRTPFKIFFGAPSCVPATGFETAGAVLDAKATATLLGSDDIWYLSEVMNYPGVLSKDKEVIAKIKAAKKAGKPVDGHAPGLKGAAAAKYAAAGITTDHECIALDEALDKIVAGMHILIREGSAAKNYEALADLLRSHPERVMFCSDDKHPDELILDHINELVRRSIAKGYDLFNVLRAACLNPVMHYKLPVGLLRENDPADFIVVKDLTDFSILQTYIDGQLVADNGKSLINAIARA
ncbi:MAG: amidohydrolase family protein [Bacteroidota bacterium]